MFFVTFGAWKAGEWIPVLRCLLSCCASQWKGQRERGNSCLRCLQEFSINKWSHWVPAVWTTDQFKTRCMLLLLPLLSALCTELIITSFHSYPALHSCPNTFASVWSVFHGGHFVIVTGFFWGFFQGNPNMEK